MKSISKVARIVAVSSVVAVFALSFAAPVLAVADNNGFPAGGNSVVVVPNGGGSGGGTGFTSCTQIINGAANIVSCIIGFFDAAVYLLIAAAVVYTVWGALTMIRDEDKREEAKKTIYYGVIALFVMVSIWGFVHILDGTFGLSGQDTIARPKLN